MRDLATPYAALLSDLRAEHQALDAVVAPLPAEVWATPTPAEGWTVHDTISHLAYFDGTARLSAVDRDAFVAARDELIAALADPADLDAVTLGEYRRCSPAELLARWRAGRVAMVDAFEALDPRSRLEWYGPPMGAMSFATARLMETWAHGQDVVDAVGADRPATDRLRHIADLGVRTRGFSYVIRQMEPPSGDVRVELTGPGGDTWSWGPADAADRVSGDALDFCLLVTQRRHRSDVGLEVSGPLADEWLGIAQAFAGGAGPGRAPRG